MQQVSAMLIRKLQKADVPSLVKIEKACFSGDSLSRRSFNHLSKRAHAVTLVADDNGVIAGYVSLLFRKTTSIARLYSIAVLPEYRKSGIARKLVEASEKAAVEAQRIVLRLEIRDDNIPSINLFHSLQYRDFGHYSSYYADGQNALRLQKFLQPEKPEHLLKVPYYKQTLNFTCGPASLLMAMATLDPSIKMTREHELQLWRESTTVFMMSGHGGCGPHGLALAAFHRGFKVKLFAFPSSIMFINSVRSDEKKEIITLVQNQFEEEINSNGIESINDDYSFSLIKDEMKRGGIPVVLTTAWFVSREKTPHWVCVTEIGEDYVWYHDPYVDVKKSISTAECMHLAVARSDFEKMCRYGKDYIKAAVIIYPGDRK